MFYVGELINFNRPNLLSGNTIQINKALSRFQSFQIQLDLFGAAIPNGTEALIVFISKTITKHSKVNALMILRYNLGARGLFGREEGGFY